MASNAGWRYDEVKQCGIDYNEAANVEVYDERHGRFRDYRAEAEAIIEVLDLSGDETVIDMGCGTGGFSINAAEVCGKIFAVDVAEPMLDMAKAKAEKAGIGNIEFCHGGFLTYEHRGDLADAVVSSVALHHLPDFWKQVGLMRIADMLKEGGKFYLYDVVYSFAAGDYESALNEWVRSACEKVGSELGADVESHVREEYSTFGWIMEGMLERAGFEIERSEYADDVLVRYLCRKKADL